MHKLQRLIFLKLLIVCPILVSCSSNTSTPKEFENAVSVSDSIYAQDSSYFVTQIMSLIEKKESAFYPESYSFTSQVHIDSILYSPDLTKSAFFVILKKPNSVILGMENTEGSHFDAKTFLAEKDDKSGEWSLKWFRIMNINRYSNYNEISKLIRTRYFEDLCKINDEDGKSRYKYNLNDVRFWESSAWSKEPQMLEQNFSGDAK